VECFEEFLEMFSILSVFRAGLKRLMRRIKDMSGLENTNSIHYE
jgi:hypothetical protein